jgi:hypothetical protein
VAVATASYADAVHDAFDAASTKVPIRTHEVDLAGRAIRLRFAGDRLDARLAPAFGHLAAPAAGTEPALVIEAWDRSAHAVAPPAPPWDVTSYGTRERIVGIDPRELRASYDSGHGLLSLHRPGSSRAAFIARDAADVPRWVARMPFRYLLGWWAGDVGLTFVHAAAVGRDDVCVLLPGSSGSGKSTTALAADDAGLTFLADDLCLLDPAARTAHAPYRWAKAEADALALVPGLRSRITETEEGQSMLRPANLVRSARVVGLALPHVTGRTETSVRPARPAEAVFALGPSTLVEGNGAGHGSLAMLAALAKRVPAAHLDVGTDMGGVVAALDGLLERWAS